jgi:hypothetical protein
LETFATRSVLASAPFLGSDVSLRQGGRQIEYEDEAPRMGKMIEEKLAKDRIKSDMDQMLSGARS